MPEADGKQTITVLIVTSPIRSNPSTQMLEEVLAGLCLIEELSAAQWLFVCDGFTIATGKQQPRHKGGVIAEEHIARYDKFIENVRELTRARSNQCDILRLPERLGFGHAVKTGLESVRTPFVLVVQHDQRIVRPFDVSSVLHVMTQHPTQLKYVGLTSVSTQTYERYAPSKFGIHVKSTREFGGIPLLPLIFFYDKPHIVPTDHYRNVIFGPDSVVKQGDFIEETYGVAMRRDIMKRGIKAQREYGTYQLDERDEAGVPLIYVAHVNGRAYLSAEQRAALGWPEKGRHTLLKKGRTLDAKKAADPTELSHEESKLEGQSEEEEEESDP